MVDESIDALNKRIEWRENFESTWYLFLSTSTRVDFLRSDPRFQEILKEHKKIYDELLEKYPDIDM